MFVVLCSDCWSCLFCGNNIVAWCALCCYFFFPVANGLGLLCIHTNFWNVLDVFVYWIFKNSFIYLFWLYWVFVATQASHHGCFSCGSRAVEHRLSSCGILVCLVTLRHVRSSQTERSNPCLLHWQADSLLLSHQESPVYSIFNQKSEPIWKNTADINFSDVTGIYFFSYDITFLLSLNNVESKS